MNDPKNPNAFALASVIRVHEVTHRTASPSVVQPMTASLKLFWTVTSPRWCRGTRGDRGTERQRRRRSSRVRFSGKGWIRGGQGGVRTGIESMEGSSDPLATGLGGYSGSDRGDSQRRSE